MKILFLGYDRTETCLIGRLEFAGYDVLPIGQDPIILEEHGDCDWVVSFGYKKIIKKDVIEHFKDRIVNLHISLLPFNRGMHPNYWAHVEGTPSGVTIHQIDEGVDTGPIYVQQLVHISTYKHTFKTSWEKLKDAVEKLFILSYPQIFDGTITPKKQPTDGTHHYAKELPEDFDWNVTIQDYLDGLQQ